MSHELEEGLKLTLDFTKIAKVAANIKEDKDHVIPVAIQHADTKEVILVAYTNRLAMELTFKTRTLTLWSTSRNVLWEKGKTSGESFEVVEARVNCEQNSLVYFVRPRRSNICHTKNAAGVPRNCYYRSINLDDGETLTNLDP
jgi:phosphoribosyl-AMP cyclohydrolase